MMAHTLARLLAAGAGQPGQPPILAVCVLAGQQAAQHSTQANWRKFCQSTSMPAIPQPLQHLIDSAAAALAGEG